MIIMEPENMWEIAVIVLALVGIGFVLLLGYYTTGGQRKTENQMSLKPLTFNCVKSGGKQIKCTWDNCYSNQTIVALSGGSKHVTDRIRGTHTFKNLESNSYHTVLLCGDKVELSSEIQIK